MFPARYDWWTMDHAPVNLLERWNRVPRARRVMLVEAIATLSLVCAALRLLPFKRAIRLGAIPLGHAKAEDDSVAEAVWAVQAAARRLPWRIVCIQSGIAVQRMLRRRSVDARLHYGIARPGEATDLQAHVWVTVDGGAVIGGEEAAKFAPVAQYP
jgi:hypothetical protein